MAPCLWAAVIGLTVAYEGIAAEPPPLPAIRGDEQVANEVPAKEAKDERATTQVLPTDGNKERLRYAGRSFADWRDQLLNDLDPETRVKAMEPIAAFGNNGYADEAVAALAQTLHGDRENVVATAAGALSQIGAPAVEALIEGLADRRPVVRRVSAHMLGTLGSVAKPATESLVKLLTDQDADVRNATITALVAVAGTDDALKPTFERIAASDDFSGRSALLEGLANAPPRGGWLLRMVARLAQDDNPRIRLQAGQLFVRSGPPEQEVIDVLNELVRDADQQVWQPTMNSLVNAVDNRETRAVVLADIFLSPDVLGRLRTCVPMENAIDALASARDQAAITVPVLADVVDMKIPINHTDQVVRAMQALGRLGPAAKAAVPALKRWADGERQLQNIDKETLKKQALRALIKIHGADRELPVDAKGNRSGQCPP